MRKMCAFHMVLCLNIPLILEHMPPWCHMLCGEVAITTE